MSVPSTFFKINRLKEKVTVTFKRLPKDDDEFQLFLDGLSSLYATKTKFSMLFDTRGLGTVQLPQKYRTKLGEWIDTNRPFAEKYLGSTAVVIQSTIVRIFVKFLIRFHPPSSPLEFYSTPRECLQYLQWTRKKKV